jgi:hypothetical protein
MRRRISSSGAVIPLAAFVLFACAVAPIPAAEEGWRPLFNGKDLDGWRMTGPGEFKVENGELVTYGGMGLLWYAKEKIGGAEIKVLFKPTRPNDNSGVFIRIDGEPQDPWFAVHNGYEVQIDNGGDEAHRTGALYSLTLVKAKVDADVDRWTEMIIRLEGDRTTVHVNGTLVTEYREGDPVPERKAISEPRRGPRPDAGYIGLQNHDADSRVRFKEVSVRPLAR